jgi:hypothetical protein
VSQIHKQTDGLVAAVTDPIIIFDPSWANVLPDWLKGEIKLQRLAQLKKGEEAYRRSREMKAVRNIMSSLSEEQKQNLK